MKPLVVIVSMLAIASALLSCGETGDVAVTPDGSQAFVGMRLFDGSGADAIENAVLVVRNGRVEAAGTANVVAIPDGAERIDLTGKTIVPGLINAHGHVNDVLGLESGHYDEANLRRQLALYARYGVTAVNSLGGDGEEATRLRDSEDETLERARITVAGEVVTGETVEEVQAAVDRNAAMGVDFIKIRVDDNLGSSTKMPPELYRAVIERAHEKSLRVASHLFYLDDAKGLLEAGTDFVAHSVRDQEVDEELVQALSDSGVCYCPTLTREVSTYVYESVPDFFEDPFFLRDADPKVLEQLRDPERMRGIADSESTQAYKKALEVAMTNLKKVSDGGGTIAFGTDTGPAARFQGYFEHMELGLMADAGLTPKQILMSATGDAARCLGFDDIGTLVPGKWADFIVLGENPLDDIENMRSIESVRIAGNEVPQTSSE
ncbi:MAG TPA: amidohydrolase family protein [Vicinamibacteria bacterium]|nr:amidohydrolase family protein [Vicinamibacteria bacterium]